ncbi:glycosyl hydrolase catalytic core-domain-containing protein [Phlebopus sp. FC_14]|nr:glycosyl hydrolase catalytic core-domain-containing protein [Phlebopus sp. FC_14]
MPAFFSMLSLSIILALVVSSTLGAKELHAVQSDRKLKSHEHTVAHTHGQGTTMEKRQRGGRNSLSQRCKPKPSALISPTSTSTTATTSTPQSSPTPAAVPSTEAKKWGLAWPNGDASYLANFARPKVRYLYTWSPYIPPTCAPLGLVGIPMLWGWNQVEEFKRLVVAGYATHVLGMNEPNEPSQSNMSPQDGASLWKQYIDPLKAQGYYLISPACTNDQAGLDWMKGFFEACNGCTIDAVAFHFYGTDPKALISHATTLHDAYNKPIWITEFADQNFSGAGGQASMDEIYAFQPVVTRFVDETPWVEAAFPFGVMYDLQGVNEGNALLKGDGQLTSLAYNYFG